MENLVDQILKEKFHTFAFEKQMEIKTNGRCTPKLVGLLQTANNNKSRSFNIEWYKRIEWLTASDVKKIVFHYFSIKD